MDAGWLRRELRLETEENPCGRGNLFRVHRASRCRGFRLERTLRDIAAGGSRRIGAAVARLGDPFPTRCTPMRRASHEAKGEGY